MPTILNKRQNNIKTILVVLISSLVLISPIYLEYLFPGVGSIGFLHLYNYLIFFFLPIVVIWFIISGILCIFSKANRRRWFPNFLIPSFILISYVISSFVAHEIRGPFPSGSFDMKFDSVKWLDSASSEFGKDNSTRERMLGDLVKNVLPGKCRDDIERLLGPSLDTPYFKSLSKDFIYYMGIERGNYFNIDSEWLLIWLDEKGCFKRFEIVND